MSLIHWLLGLEAPTHIVQTADWTLRALASVHPAWLAAVAILGLLAAGVNFLSSTAATMRTRILLAVIRLSAAGLLILLLARAEVDVTVTREVEPRVAVMVDRSASMAVRDVGDAMRGDAADVAVARMKSSLAGKASVEVVEFDWSLRDGRAVVPTVSATMPASQPASASQPAPRDLAPGTRLYESLEQLAQRQAELRAVVLLTDGHDTSDQSAGRAAPTLRARGTPVFPIVLGDPQAARLARVRISGASPVARLGDEIRLSATATAQGVPEQTVAVRVYEEGNPIAIATRENVTLGKAPVDLSFVVRPTKAGRRVYRIALEGVKGSSSQQTLVARHEVEVIDARIKVLLLDIPRDERKILSHWLARDPVVDLATLTMMPKAGWFGQGRLQHKDINDGLPADEAELFRYDVIVMGDIPRAVFRAGGDTSEARMQRLVEFVSRRGGGLVTMGGRSVYGAGRYQESALARALPFEIDTGDDGQIPKTFKLALTQAGISHPIMQLESEAQANREAWLDLAALDGSNRVGAARPGATVLASRPMESGAVPMIALQNVGKGQVLSMAIDTTWRWEMMRPLDSEDYFRRFWGNVVRWMAPDPRLSPHEPRMLRYESEPAVGRQSTLAIRLVDESFRPVRSANLSVRVVSPSGRVTTYYPSDGRQAPGLYEYDLTPDEPGIWEAATTYRGKTTLERIIVGGGATETDDPRAMPEAMARLAQSTGGRAFTADGVDAAISAIDLSLQRVTRRQAIALWNLPIVLIALIGLVCVDCYIRKRRGMV